jgi:hypothetical protein
MTDGTVDTSPQLYARIAGVSYLVGALLSVLGQMVVLGMIVVSGNATATVANMLSHETLFRLGFVLSVMTVPFHLVWAVLFNGLFRPVNRNVSLLAGFVMLMACMMWTLSLQAGIGTARYKLSLAGMVLSAVLFIIVLIWSNRSHYLTLDTKLESPSFFAKNREEFGKQAVTATISGLIGGAIGYLFGHYLK